MQPIKLDTKTASLATETMVQSIDDIANGKSFWKSKTCWVNAIMIFAAIMQLNFGVIIDANMQLIILAVVNGILRHYTTEPVIYKKPKAVPPEQTPTIE